MSKRANPTAIGAFVVAALALAVIGIITLGGMQLFKKELPFVMFFDGDIGGLDVGAPVEIRGVKIGAVTKIRLFAGTNNIGKIGVYVNIDPALLPKDAAVRTDVDAVENLIKRGLRAQLKTQSLLTGQLLVYLDLFPGTAIALVGLDPDVREIPTIPTTLEQLQARVEKIFDKLGAVKFDELIRDVSLTLKGAKELMASPELKAVVVSANTALQSANTAIQDADKVLKRLDAKLETIGANTDAALVETRELMAEARKSLAKIDAQVEPLATSIKDTSTSAQGTLRTLDRAVDGDSRVGYEALRALRDVADAARSLKTLADYLERHPDALLRGKGGPENK
jgi:paraquat-inducible protein B